MNNTLFDLIVLSTFFIILLTLILSTLLIVRLSFMIAKQSKKFPRYNLIAVFICLIWVFVFFFNWIYNPKFLPTGIESRSIASPTGHYEAKVYNYSGLYDIHIRIKALCSKISCCIEPFF